MYRYNPDKNKSRAAEALAEEANRAALDRLRSLSCTLWRSRNMPDGVREDYYVPIEDSKIM